MLKVEHLHTYYGESHVLQGVDLSVTTAQCVAVLGRNGAGKTTTLRSILGLTPARRGRVVFNEIDITRLPTHRIVKSGIAFVPEDRGIFPTVTVEEHLAIAYGASKRRPRRKPIEYVFEIFPRLAERRKSLGGQLSGGEQQMLAIGRALVAGPDLMILDEPSEGLAPVIIEKLEAVLMDIKASGTPLLLVEQNYHLATQLADYVYVLSQGRVQFAGDTKSLIANDDIRRMYLSV
ncbi:MULTISPECIES: ABC transporter ATP-binding protein [Bradyrhizobium]|uniref:ABC transporter ATP-binding protein n=1 Tax=Bradyrhizobium TaxID=374 RepID=UPI001B8A6D8A|nr:MULTISPECIES: ABC transporter ATP-binding protein [Bradyrhizobium]MBR0815283.1 ABC transporter ATP-binding protein [Bradyrhizobium diazoefficiens]MBR1130926.1 ABC transporter ATP-binding protein [Bradyrhizobium iriomotense]